MTRQEATDLAVRILGVFQGPQAGEWEETLGDLDAGRAGTAFVRCKRDHKHRWLAIADYLERYAAIHVDDASTRADPCTTCDDTGWVEAPRFLSHGEVYSGVEPCRCREGQRRAEGQTWRNAPVRQILTDREADTLVRALREPKEDPA